MKRKGIRIEKNGSFLAINVFVQRETFGKTLVCKTGAKWVLDSYIFIFYDI